jgi:GT2 family glycosyltransferase
MSDWPSVTIAVLNYNGLEHLQDCFASLTKVDYPAERLELMLVDNASTDGSVEYMQTHYPGVRVVRSGENVGFAAGNNLGAQAATGQYVVFLNNDMWVDPQFVQELVKAIRVDPDVVCGGAMILNWDGNRIDFWGAAAHFAGYGYQMDVDRPFNPDQCIGVQPSLFSCGGAMMIDRQIFLDVGGFDEDYFIYYEDVDLGWRLWLLGYKVVLVSRALVYHRHHGTMNSFSDYRKQVLFKRNALYTVIKNYSDENLGKVLPAILLASVDGLVTQAVRRGQLDTEEYHIKSAKKSRRSIVALDKSNVSTLIAVHDVVAHLPHMMEKRCFIQEKRQRSDRDITPLFQHPFKLWPGVDPQTQYAVAEVFDIQRLFEDVPRRVLVISSDILPYPGMPTVGSGLRAWGLGQGLKSRGHEVLFSMPRAALNGREEIAPPEAVELAWQRGKLSTVVRLAGPDVIVVCNWPLMGMLPTRSLGVPVILDQHGPHYLEREYQNFGNSESNAQQKILALQRADFFTCAGEKQLAYFQSWLERAGWTEQEQRERAAAIPVSLSPDLPEGRPNGELTFVYGGVFLPWQDPSNGLTALVETMERRNSGKLYFFGGKHPVYSLDTGIFEALLAQLEKSPHVVAPGMVSHDDLIATYTQAHVAIDMMKRNSERELAFTTRTVEYLWCGLPVIYNDYAELSDYIREYNAGWIVDPEDREAIAAVLDDIFEHPEQAIERGRNAQRLVQERLSWDKTIGPLDAFIRHPRMRLHDLSQKQTVQERIRYLLDEARFHYRRGGLEGLWKESWAFFKRSRGLF